MESTWLSLLVQQQPCNHPITKTERQKRYKGIANGENYIICVKKQIQ